MPYSYLIDLEREVVFSKVWGTLTDEHVMAHAAALKEDPRFDSELSQIIDMRELSDLQVTSPGIRKVAHVVPFRPDARRAFIVGTGEAERLSRVLWAYTEAGVDQYTLFRDLPPAMEWVGLDPTTPWPEQAPDKTFGAD
jgi:hypothetical protein